MTTMTLTALYDSRAEADQASERLVREAGVARAGATVHAQDATAPRGAAASGAGESTGFFGSGQRRQGGDTSTEADGPRGGSLASRLVLERPGGGASRRPPVFVGCEGAEGARAAGSWRRCPQA